MNLLTHDISSSIRHLNKGVININPEETKKTMLPELTFAFSLYAFLVKQFKEKRLSVNLSIVIIPNKDFSKVSTLKLDASLDYDNDLFPEKTLEALKSFRDIYLINVFNCMSKSIRLTFNKKAHTIIARGEVNADINLQSIECDDTACKDFIGQTLTSKKCTGIEFELLNKVISIPSKSRFVIHQTNLLEETVSGTVRVHKIGYDLRAKTIGEINFDFRFSDKYLLQLNELYIKNKIAKIYLKQHARTKAWNLEKIEPIPNNQSQFKYKG